MTAKGYPRVHFRGLLACGRIGVTTTDAGRVTCVHCLRNMRRASGGAP